MRSGGPKHHPTMFLLIQFCLKMRQKFAPKRAMGQNMGLWKKKLHLLAEVLYEIWPEMSRVVWHLKFAILTKLCFHKTLEILLHPPRELLMLDSASPSPHTHVWNRGSTPEHCSLCQQVSVDLFTWRVMQHGTTGGHALSKQTKPEKKVPIDQISNKVCRITQQRRRCSFENSLE